MYAHELLHKTLLKTLPSMHEKRRKSIVNAVRSLLIGKALTLTLLGRNMPGRAKERHNIRKVDRLLGNTKLHDELITIYQTQAKMILQGVSEVVIAVDWSAVNKKKDFHILRAGIILKGRSHVIYQETHPGKKVTNKKVHTEFLTKLKEVLPGHVHALLITDAGFLNPWFKAAAALGFTWLGRTKGTIHHTQEGKDDWKSCSTLYEKATNKAQTLGSCLLTKLSKLPCQIVIYKEPSKGRIMKTRRGTKSRNTQSKRVAKRASTPWVLVTSLDGERYTPTVIKNLYKKRMQIEEGFRDTKSTRYSFHLRESMSKSAKRIDILLVIATLGTFVCWLMALVSIRKKTHYDYQANTIKDRTVLSGVYLGCQLVRRKVPIKISEAKQALRDFRAMIYEAAQ